MKYEDTFTVRSYEVDIRNILRPTPLIQYMQETADHQMRDLDVDYIDLWNKGRKAFVVSRMSIEVYEKIPKYTRLTARTWCTGGRAANFPRAYEIEADGKIAARAMSNWALVNVDTGRLIRYNEYDMSNYPMDEEPELQIPLRFMMPKDLGFEVVEECRVANSMIDMNMHMNNAIYSQKLYDNIPDAGKYLITSINQRFVHEAPFGSEMKIFSSGIVDAGDMDPRADQAIWFYTEAAGKKNIEAVFGLKRA
jgi:medium-chain acyl-[acyl-carrier-protein] hydrolase